MNHSFIIACLAASAFAGKHLDSSEKMGQDPGFMNFMAQNNKNQYNVGEFQLRQANYHANVNAINASNRQHGSNDPDALVLKINYTGDWSSEEYRKWLTLPADTKNKAKELPAHSHGARANLGRPDGRKLQSSVDHAALGNMHAVKSQGNCGSCWAFSGNTVAEGTLAAKTGSEPVHLSEQHMVDCTLSPTAPHNPGNNSEGKDYNGWGCQGAWTDTAWNYAKDNGFMLDSDYPYTSGSSQVEGTCAHNDSKTVGKVMEWGQIQSSIDDVKAKLRDQPLSVALDAGSQSFQFYSSGVLKVADNCGNTLNHAVTLVGYSDGGSDDTNPPQPDDDDTNPPQPDDDDTNPPQPDDDDTNPPQPGTNCTVTKWWHTCEGDSTRRLQDDNTPYWKVQNSWGAGWGDQGFIKIEITDGEGVCGINSVIEWMEWVDKY